MLAAAAAAAEAAAAAAAEGAAAEGAAAAAAAAEAAEAAAAAAAEGAAAEGAAAEAAEAAAAEAAKDSVVASEESMGSMLAEDITSEAKAFQFMGSVLKIDFRAVASTSIELLKSKCLSALKTLLSPAFYLDQVKNYLIIEGFMHVSKEFVMSLKRENKPKEIVQKEVEKHNKTIQGILDNQEGDVKDVLKNKYMISN